MPEVSAEEVRKQAEEAQARFKSNMPCKVTIRDGQGTVVRQWQRR